MQSFIIQVIAGYVWQILGSEELLAPIVSSPEKAHLNRLNQVSSLILSSNRILEMWSRMELIVIFQFVLENINLLVNVFFYWFYFKWAILATSFCTSHQKRSNKLDTWYENRLVTLCAMNEMWFICMKVINKDFTIYWENNFAAKLQKLTLIKKRDLCFDTSHMPETFRKYVK